MCISVDFIINRDLIMLISYMKYDCKVRGDCKMYLSDFYKIQN